MYKFILISGLGLLTACSGMPNTELIVEKEMHILDRQEVINAIEDCKSANLRAVLFYGRRKINDKPVPVIVDVTCAPKSGV